MQSNFSPDSSPSPSAIPASAEAHHLRERGFTGLRKILAPTDLTPLWRAIYDRTAEALVPHDSALPLGEKVQLPWRENVPYETWSRLMKEVNDSRAFWDLAESDKVRSAFDELLGRPAVIYPITRFRALLRDIPRSHYGWHQDEGVQYAMKVKDLAYWNPVTLWISVNGATAADSLELVPGSHRGHLETHEFVEGQGHFRAQPPKDQATFVVPNTAPGEGVFFDALLFHRSVVPQGRRPRYSLDIRYCPESGRRKTYAVRMKFRLQRFFRWTES